ncbi:MAG: sigma-70 family RNA polymerase sigma factor [Crocinitomicaceae bacterium]
MELLPLIKEGSRKAEGEIFIRYSPLVMGLCLKYLKQSVEAEDMMMRIFERLPSKIKKSEITNFKNWLYTVVRNECFMELRKKQINTSDFETALIYTEDFSNKQLQEVLEKEKKITEVESSLAQLKDEQRTCIELFYIKKLDYASICKETGYELKKVKSFIQNGKRNLKLIIEGKK